PRPGCETRKGRGQRLYLLWPIACCLAAWLALPSRAATPPPRENLLQLVPNDVGFCMVVSDLREHSKQLRDAPWVKALRESPLGRKIAQSPEAKKLKELENQLLEKLGVGLDRLRDDILGDAVVFAYWPGPPGKPKEERGVILLWARDPKLLAQVA